MLKNFKNLFIFIFFLALHSCNQNESDVQKRLNGYDIKLNPPPGTFQNRDVLNVAVWVGGLTAGDSLLITTAPLGAAEERPCSGSSIPPSAKCYRLKGKSVDVIAQMYGISHGKGVYSDKRTFRYTLVPPPPGTPQTEGP